MNLEQSFAPCVLSFALILSGGAVAQSYPSKPVKIICPYPASGGTDILARVIGDALSQSMGQQFIVDNRSGASGRIGTEIAAKSAPDGYTLLMATSGPNTILPAAYSDLPYDPISSFAPISQVATAEYILVVHPSLPVQTISQLIALAKAKPKAIRYASTGTFGAPHMAMELMEDMAGIEMTHVPYRGGTPAITSVVSGETSIMFVTVPSGMNFVNAGRARALATSATKQSTYYPNLPPVSKTLPGFDVSQWYGFMAPAGTPKEIVSRLHAEIVKAVGQTKIRSEIMRQGGDVVTTTPEEFEALVRSDLEKWRRVIKAPGLKP